MKPPKPTPAQLHALKEMDKGATLMDRRNRRGFPTDFRLSSGGAVTRVTANLLFDAGWIEFVKYRKGDHRLRISRAGKEAVRRSRA